MRAAGNALWQSALDWWNSVVGLALFNLLWLAMSATVILLPFATVGLYAVTHEMALGTGQGFSSFWEGIRRYKWHALRWGLLNSVALILLTVDLAFYRQLQTPLRLPMLVILLAMGSLWIAVQFYTFPMLMVQQDKRLRLALKNALFLVFASPFYTFMLLLIVGLLLLMSMMLIFPLGMGVISFIALLGNRAVLERLQTFGKYPKGDQNAL